MNRKKPVLISGIQPTGKLHLGNYLGALKNFIELQNSDKYRCYFFIADLHSLTENFDPKEKSKQILELTTDYLAAGLNPRQSVIFLQSAIPAHSELAIILNNFTPFGEARRMTQFKEKSEVAPKNINVGLFDYPVLMAADILLYDTQLVPVGEDQLQHLELTRLLVRKFNAKFGKTFIEPRPILTKTPRIMSLDNPFKKMAKSQPNGCLFLDDSLNEIQKKIKTAVTDSGKEIIYDEKRKPAISNLLLIYSGFSGKPIKEIENRYRGKGYADFKKDLAEVIIKSLKPFQVAKEKLIKNSAKVKEIINEGNKKANIIASRKIIEVKKKIGLIW